MLLTNVYHGGQILTTSTGMGYDIRVACTFSTNDTINIHDLKRWIHVGLELLPSHFNLSINARINTTQPALSNFYSLFGVVSEKIWGILKQQLPTKCSGIKH
jgi:hypothetical protein